MKKVLTHWIGIPEDFSPEGLSGFVYLIVNTLSNKKYVGRKYLWSKTSCKIKGKSRRKRTVKESDWRTYKSSSDDLKADIARLGPDAFTFAILSIHKTRAEVNYAEVKEQFSRDVLYAKLPDGNFEYYNSCILNRYYRKRLTED
jgi:hypothetical protein